jgi:hypothetical protein
MKEGGGGGGPELYGEREHRSEGRRKGSGSVRWVSLPFPLYPFTLLSFLSRGLIHIMLLYYTFMKPISVVVHGAALVLIII